MMILTFEDPKALLISVMLREGLYAGRYPCCWHHPYLATRPETLRFRIHPRLMLSQPLNHLFIARPNMTLRIHISLSSVVLFL